MSIKYILERLIIISLVVMTMSCNNEIENNEYISLGETNLTDNWSWSLALPSEIDELTEGSIIYMTNYIKNIKTTIKDGVVLDTSEVEGTIESYSVVIDFYDHNGAYFGTSNITKTTPVLYKDTDVNVIYFPDETTESDRLAPTFSVRLCDLTVSYEGVEDSVFVEELPTMDGLSAFVVYFQSINIAE